ncbi:MAG: YigZ family protein [Bacteroidota bacterium]|nr:YigZ family protein [Candidatus Kapabacteria bacterium]MCS7301929.1 YigZ family protein [Candidatus Kapabacteria bacterium]MCX7936615.1 YigZ family protein [Chlorobiota bacterium]MDW8074808.1 YigZ family protein [Bacteroidota bacterium]MDW8271447.1 YigZ family protein [Bacteroidota bacterium]
MNDSTILYYTLSGESRSEHVIKGSRFVATAIPVASKEDVLVHIERIRRNYPTAAHYCYAYRIGIGGMEYRTWDDGEPAGSAGKPILFVIQKYRLSDVLVVVVRYVGNAKLGLGMLARAYASVTEKVLATAERVPVVRYVSVRIFCAYEDVDAVIGILHHYALDFEAEYRDAVEFTARIRESALEEFSAELSTATGTRAGFIVLEQS